MSALDTSPATALPGCAHCPPGETISHRRPGDFILVRDKGWLGWLIRCLVGNLRYRTPADRPYTYWTHAALVISNAGHMVEVNPRGVVTSHIRLYRDRDYHYVSLDLPEADRKAAVQFARSCLGQKYSVRNFLLLVISAALGDRICMPDSGHQCASLVVGALQQAGIRFERKPNDMTPADLAKHFGVTP
jgi:uncharacterized protein YycO